MTYYTLYLFYDSFNIPFLYQILDVTSIETAFELSCSINLSIDFDGPATPPNLMIDCIANGIIAEMFCIYDSGTASEIVTECECPVLLY